MEPHDYNAFGLHLNQYPNVNRSMPKHKLRREDSATLQTVSGLKRELEKLRESSKTALQKSWAEVEQLQAEALAYFERINALERELEASHMREEEWRRQCEGQMTTIDLYKRKEEEQVCAAASMSPRMASKNRRRNSLLAVFTRHAAVANNVECCSELSQGECTESTTSIDSTHGDLSTEGDHAVESDPSLDECQLPRKLRVIIDSAVGTGPNQMRQDERERLESELLKYLKMEDLNKNEVIATLNMKISYQESAILELERTAEHQSESLWLLSLDLDRVQTESARQIKTQQERVREKKKIIIEQMGQLKNFQEYITKLAEELEKYMEQGKK
mmetsp:Transcript_12041/g.15194  ORF Transcript_12041/g.15194 Transcript_12041/m.15194 type:complete len:332 (+) Transcript_12041:64-1059(+)